MDEKGLMIHFMLLISKMKKSLDAIINYYNFKLNGFQIIFYEFLENNNNFFKNEGLKKFVNYKIIISYE